MAYENGFSALQRGHEVENHPVLAIRVESDGDVICLYDDSLELGTIGKLDIRRASRVEFDPEAAPGGAWVAEDLATGERIAVSSRRADCLCKEVDYYNRLIALGYRPQL